MDPIVRATYTLAAGNRVSPPNTVSDPVQIADSPAPKDLVSGFRKSTLRSRGGCIKCKARHVKCDETKPGCRRCHAWGITCEYVVNPPKRSKPPESVTSVPNVGHVVFIPFQPSIVISGNRAERRSFHYIQARNLTEIFGRCEIDLWNTAMLAYSHYSPAVRNSLFALSAIFEIYERESTSSSRAGISITTIGKYALSIYNKAVAEIIQSLKINENGQKSDRRIVLLSCLVFSWIEIMLGNFDGARWHIESGIKIINDIVTSPTDAFERDDPDDVYVSLQRSFLRLRFQTTIGLEAVPLTQQRLADTISKLPLPAKERPVDTKQALAAEKEPEVSPSPDKGLTWTLQGRLRQIDRLRRADDAVKTLPASQIQEEDRKRSLTYANIKLSGTMLSLMTKPPADGPDGPDHARYAEVVEAVEDIYNRKRFIESSPVSLDIGVINPLLFVLRWCKDSTIKQRAFYLLKAGPKREGSWKREDVIALVEQQGMLADTQIK